MLKCKGKGGEGVTGWWVEDGDKDSYIGVDGNQCKCGGLIAGRGQNGVSDRGKGGLLLEGKVRVKVGGC
jgi:hypothetical protein